MWSLLETALNILTSYEKEKGAPLKCGFLSPECLVREGRGGGVPTATYDQRKVGTHVQERGAGLNIHRNKGKRKRP